MSLPLKYNNCVDYFHDAITFLRNYHWLFSIPNTRILSENLLNFIPSEWRIHLESLSTQELNNLPFGFINEGWPATLKEFIEKIESLKPQSYSTLITHDINLPKQFFIGLNQKKKHEILTLAPFINEQCKANNINIIIDIGTGLGYLSQLLYEQYGYDILAIEADEKKVHTAIRRQNELYSNSTNHVKYIHHFVNENSAEFLQEILKSNQSDSNNACLIGLHACADLTISLLKLFHKMDSVKQAIVMPCCYHRLEKITNQQDSVSRDVINPELFVNFPVSRSLHDLYDREKAANFLTSSFLRLACQNTASNWREMSLEDHRKHSIGAMRRAVLQLVAEQEGYHLSRLKRKTRFNTENDDFLSYLEGLKHTHIVTNTSISNEENLIETECFRDKMSVAWKIYEKDCDLLEVYTAFQTSIQSVCENVILLDRVEMVKDWGHDCYARKVTNDSVSPRCYALVARKQVNM